MDLSFSAEELAFRDEVRAWIADAMPPHIKKKADDAGHFEMPEVMEWHKVLYEKGWVAPHWPKEHGGPGFTATERFLFSEELELAGAPILSPFGLVMVGPLIQRFGTEEQKKRFLPKILSGEEVWCQGYSEPNAGSDLASLRTMAIDEGDHFVVTGQKTWTTYAQYADWIFCLVRTSTEGKKQAGISFLLIPLDTPGVEVKPMLTLGHTPAFCDTYFENAKVPKENLLGPLNGGWNLAKALLGHERTLVAAVGHCRRNVRLAKRIAAHQLGADGKPLLEDPYWRERIARLEMRLRAHQMTNYRALAEQQKGKHPGPESSILKLVGSELVQQTDELCMELMGPDSLNWFNGEGAVAPFEQWVGPMFCYDRATTIYAGSNEIQKNIIAKLILGLPKK
ncbi:MAG TPA: acyl-CoA dehydrogenase family protein [Polyangiaceae bacterium LLY-WYZ-15_(1-7)]|nr:pimeloyl-CoA dehydrogenase large subunit [Sandaracinus sp.]HJK93131.1 acyl-CoA dehydrogenase family protein [Polyangiaceae bacterium LLY-WYZ-15_(1-7)]HJL03172.1 acyl-CoA dehydrogenase family protein [Polyangiaceae bacterium LLY-WYZ-15_(1-7)]HJL10300.1 acyl-CoA dehydrogenase family protein [Polyangiaceae bacterium LLY-WYZ-15_(1-7)]HJL26449.1 acyl-CoA dehydrogenase family protein [Polyangiaceae bacterium LLY-WYZ-15_(1-7)]